LALDAVGANAGSGPWNDDLHHIEEVYLGEGGEFLVVEHHGQIVGMGALRKTDAQHAEIKRMRVHPRHWRRGLGQALLRKLEERAGQLGYRRLRLDTTIEMTAAQQLYRKNGYREAGRGRLGKFEVLYFEKEMPGH
jgi:ribosomal protein S18 acetylase RimI-like enzyme